MNKPFLYFSIIKNCAFLWIPKMLEIIQETILTEADTYPQLPTHSNFFFIRSKLIQGSNMVILSCLTKKNQNLNARKKNSVY